MRFLRAKCLVCLGILPGIPASAKVATISLEQLTIRSELIVIAEVTAIEECAGVRIARVGTVTSIKGMAPTNIAFVAESTWTCDISSASIGERVLLYLRPVGRGEFVTMNGQDLSAARDRSSDRGITLFALTHAGRGRIPLQHIRRRWVAKTRTVAEKLPELLVNLVLPSSAPIGREQDGTATVSLSYLVKLTRQAISVPRWSYQ